MERLAVDWTDLGEGEGVELSGLAGTGGQIAPPALQAAHTGTDEMHYSLRPVKIPAGDNLPTLEGEVVPVSPYIGEVVGGFSRMLRLFHEHREDLAAPQGPLAAFSAAIICTPCKGFDCA